MATDRMGPVTYGNDDPRSGGATGAAQEWENLNAKNAYAKNGLGAGADIAANSSGSRVNEDPGLSNQFAGGANGNVSGATGLARSMAEGQMPSAAAYQLQAGLNQGLAQQQSIGNSARGGAALATAQSNAQNNSAAMQQNAYSAAGQLRAQEMATGRGLYASLTDQTRGLSNDRLTQANDVTAGNGARADNFNLNMGGAAVGIGQVENRFNGQELNNDIRGHAPSVANDDAEEDYRVYLANKEANRVRDNKEDNG